MRTRFMLLLLVLLLSACRAPGDALLEACTEASDATDGVAACTTAIESGKLSGGSLGDAHLHRAIAYVSMSQFRPALADIDVALPLLPERTAEIRTYRGIVNGQAGDLAAALVEFDAALAIDPKRFDASVNRAKVLADSGQFARSLPEFDRALELEPGNSIALNGRCWSRAVLNVELDQAFADCDAAARAGGEDFANNLNSRAFVQYRRGKYREAIVGYSESLEHREMASSYFVRGLARRAIGEAGADADIERAMALEPGVRERFATYGVNP